MTRQRLGELTDRWVRSWSPEVAAGVVPPSPGVLYKVCRQYPEEWCHRAMRLITRDMHASRKLRNPGALLYAAARDGRTAYFPEHPPTLCEHCDDGVLLSSFEKCCQECAPRLREEELAREKSDIEAAKTYKDILDRSLYEAEREVFDAYERVQDIYTAKYGNVHENYLKASSDKKAGRPRE